MEMLSLLGQWRWRDHGEMHGEVMDVLSPRGQWR